MRQLALWVEERISSCESLIYFAYRLILQVDSFLNFLSFHFFYYFYLNFLFFKKKKKKLSSHHFKWLILLSTWFPHILIIFPLFNYCFFLLCFQLFTFYIFFRYTYQLGVKMYFSPSNQNSHYYYYHDFLCFFSSFGCFVYGTLCLILFFRPTCWGRAALVTWVLTLN